MPTPRRCLASTHTRSVVENCFIAESPPTTGGERIGLEFEWLTISASRPGDRLDLGELQMAATGEGALPAGSSITFEPGGQIELDTLPHHGLRAACAAAREDAQELGRRLERMGVGLVAIGLDAVRPPLRVLRTDRYDAMEAAFDVSGPYGRRMMCNTAALQVNVDLGADPVDARWRLAHALGPTMVACFANSPFGEKNGRGQPIGWVANRTATWWGIDPSRTAPPTITDDPVSTWLEYALAAKVLLIRTVRGAEPELSGLTFGAWMANGHDLGWPTSDDFAYHLTTLFPPVRPRGWLELRMLDALDDDLWPVAVAMLVALLTDPEAADRAARATTHTANLWLEAAQHGLRHPALAASADECIDATLEALPRLDDAPDLSEAVARYGEAYVSQRRCPADDRLDEYHRFGRLLPCGASVDQPLAAVD